MSYKRVALLAGFLSISAGGAIRAEDTKKPEKLDLKELHVHPYCSTEPSPLLDTRTKGIFDELKVSLNSSTGTRFHIGGKKKNDTGKIGNKVVYHLGKLVTTAATVTRTGTIVVQPEKGKENVAGNYVALVMGDNTVKASIYKISDSQSHKWILERGPETTTLTVMEGDAEAIKISAPTSDVREFGFASTVRSVNDVADVTVTFD